MTKVFIENTDFMYDLLMRACGFKIVNSFIDADVLLFTGGTDVNPSFYGEERGKYTDVPDAQRDAFCVRMYEHGEANNLLMLGICRGSQFLTVMQGGKLVQHQDWHKNGKHMVMMAEDNRLMPVTSSHHQCMLPNRKVTEVLASSGDAVVEIHRTKDFKQLAVQGHPEWCDDEHPFFQWYVEQVKYMLDVNKVMYG